MIFDIVFNRLLTNKDREFYTPLINKMFSVCPDTMSRKITDANVQQAFVINTVLNLGSKEGDSILSVGSFECTATEYLYNTGWEIFGIDPEFNYDLHTYYEKFRNKFNFIISVSVMEHVKDDELFIYEICNSLKSSGIAILTCDFNNNYIKGEPVPYSDYRLYTEYDLDVRLRNIIESNGCSYIGKTDWKGKPDFIYQGHHYSFATMIFEKV
jgi:SAM-dependent methyltransferase